MEFGAVFFLEYSGVAEGQSESDACHKQMMIRLMMIIVNEDNDADVTE